METYFVKCVDAKGLEDLLTVGKEYEVFHRSRDDFYLIRDDTGKRRYYSVKRFVSLGR
jgi:hypothetical protein